MLDYNLSVLWDNFFCFSLCVSVCLWKILAQGRGSWIQVLLTAVSKLNILTHCQYRTLASGQSLPLHEACRLLVIPVSTTCELCCMGPRLSPVFLISRKSNSGSKLPNLHPWLLETQLLDISKFIFTFFFNFEGRNPWGLEMLLCTLYLGV